MALPHVNAIGPYQFISLEGNIARPTQKVEVFARVGLNGVGVRRRGIKGAPFTLMSYNFVAPAGPNSGFQEAKDLYDTYKTSIGTGALTVYRHSVDEGLFHVHGIEEAQPPIAVVNALVADIFFEANAVLQTLAWTLVAE